jgi:hypothetical protein
MDDNNLWPHSKIIAIDDEINYRNEYIITLKNFNDLDSFYNEMESESLLLNRKITCTAKRPLSRSTQYLLSSNEANFLKSDPRIESIELHPRHTGIKADLFSTKKQSSTNWNKSVTTYSEHLNWGLLRCYEGQARSDWPIAGNTPSYNATGTIDLAQTGKNVDVVMVDGGDPVPYHPEYAANADGTGDPRMKQIDWYTLYNPIVKGVPAESAYTFDEDVHASHTSGTVAGNTQGWARDANIYNIKYYAGGELATSYNEAYSYCIDYVRAFHANKPINPDTGRKNPTICNNSWGMSLFPGEYTYNDITAVTYRGVRHELSGPETYRGMYGVYAELDRKYSSLIGYENVGNRITTSGNNRGYVISANASDSLSWTSGPSTRTKSRIIGNSTYDVHYFLEYQPNYGSPKINHITQEVIVKGPGYIYPRILSQSATPTLITIRFYITDDDDNIGFDRYARSFSIPGYTSTATLDLGSPVWLPDNINYHIKLDHDCPSEYINYRAELDFLGEYVFSAPVTEIPNILLGPGSLTESTMPDHATAWKSDDTPNDDGYWTLDLPFNIEYFKDVFNKVYVSTNGFLLFGGGTSFYDESDTDARHVFLPKIAFASGDNSTQRIYYGTEGTSPNRTFRIRIEATPGYSGTLGDPKMLSEYVFYEAIPNQIDLQLGINKRKFKSGNFTTEQLNSWGIFEGERIPQRLASLDADIRDAIADGIIFVGAAGNGNWYHDVPGGPDWDNTFEMESKSGLTYYYHRGSSPTAVDVDMPNICVGAINVTTATDLKAYYSDYGPGVDIWAPGSYIISSVQNYQYGVDDLRSTNPFVDYQFVKLSGTSMASPQVCGVLACALEIYPDMKQAEAKEYITKTGKLGQATGISSGPNLFLYYKRERESIGYTFPKVTFKARPTSGATYPRTRIKRRK